MYRRDVLPFVAQVQMGKRLERSIQDLIFCLTLMDQTAMDHMCKMLVRHGMCARQGGGFILELTITASVHLRIILQIQINPGRTWGSSLRMMEPAMMG